MKKGNRKYKSKVRTRPKIGHFVNVIGKKLADFSLQLKCELIRIKYPNSKLFKKNKKLCWQLNEKPKVKFCKETINYVFCILSL